MTVERIVLFGFILLAVLILTPYLFWWSIRFIRESRRRRSMRDLAQEWGAAFHATAPQKLSQVSHFRLFEGLRAKPGQRVRNLVTRESKGRSLSVFDYQWKGYHSDDDFDSTESWSVIHIECDQLDLPPFDVRPNGFYLKLTAKRRPKIDTTEHPGFAKAYDLSCEQEEAIRDLFSWDVLDLIAGSPRELQIEGLGSDLILYTNPRKFTLRSLLTALGGGPDEGRLGPIELLQMVDLADNLCQLLVNAKSQPNPSSPNESTIKNSPFASSNA